MKLIRLAMLVSCTVFSCLGVSLAGTNQTDANCPSLQTIKAAGPQLLVIQKYPNQPLWRVRTKNEIFNGWTLEVENFKAKDETNALTVAKQILALSNERLYEKGSAGEGCFYYLNWSNLHDVIAIKGPAKYPPN